MYNVFSIDLPLARLVKTFPKDFIKPTMVGSKPTVNHFYGWKDMKGVVTKGIESVAPELYKMES